MGAIYRLTLNMGSHVLLLQSRERGFRRNMYLEETFTLGLLLRLLGPLSLDRSSLCISPGLTPLFTELTLVTLLPSLHCLLLTQVSEKKVNEGKRHSTR